MKPKSSDPFCDPELEALIQDKVPNAPPSARTDNSANSSRKSNQTRPQRLMKKDCKEDENVSPAVLPQLAEDTVIHKQVFKEEQIKKNIVSAQRRSNVQEEELDPNNFEIEDDASAEEPNPFEVSADDIDLNENEKKNDDLNNSLDISIEELPKAPKVPIVDDEDEEENSKKAFEQPLSPPREAAHKNTQEDEYAIPMIGENNGNKENNNDITEINNDITENLINANVEENNDNISDIEVVPTIKDKSNENKNKKEKSNSGNYSLSGKNLIYETDESAVIEDAINEQKKSWHYENVPSLQKAVKKKVDALIKMSRSRFPATKDSKELIIKLVEQSRALHEFQFIEKRVKYFEKENRDLMANPTSKPKVTISQQRELKKLTKDLADAEKKIEHLKLLNAKPLQQGQPKNIFEIDDELGALKIDNQVALTKEKESLASIKSEVDELQSQVDTVEKRIALMKQKKSNYAKENLISQEEPRPEENNEDTNQEFEEEDSDDPIPDVNDENANEDNEGEAQIETLDDQDAPKTEDTNGDDKNEEEDDDEMYEIEGSSKNSLPTFTEE
ncbi:hypothetical protein TRFO_39314 [Tritrichomonas foetus]|uniref:Uncharacterized protein n=1 Tax=Tritrichomonas foetus TaxID=1144522 RepID=A0A1J4JB99_9EUKA|nr:hypothetical protein TRFO_39314 [Tritrichomonas foetus]|eukprot:OHS94524.1 hypothetical protein TRFO_39314 [Tritrichomonas foetus]